MTTAKQPRQGAKFTSGSILNHITVMSFTGAIGLLALFCVDLLDMYFLSLLGEVELAAAIGFAGSILFFTSSICIGLLIATSALTARALGADDGSAGGIVVNALALNLLIAALVAAVMLPFVPDLLHMLGATGRTHGLAVDYLYILMPMLPALGLGMSAGGVLRAAGAAKHSMMVTVSGAIVNAVLDPILIFGLDLGLEGAAIASAFARVTMGATGLYLVFVVHKFRAPISRKSFISNVRPALKVALPATLTNVATPIGNAYVISTIAVFGDAIVAGNTIVARITPVAFALLFSLSGAVGPIIGQNLGARSFDRVRETVSTSLKFIGVYTAVLWVIFYLAQDGIISVFGASEEAASIIRVFCIWVVPLTYFLGALFVANAAFNNLGHPFRATFFNVGKATLGTMPFAYFGAVYYGPEGVLIWPAVGAMLFGVAATIVCFRTISRLALNDEAERGEDILPETNQPPMLPYSSARTFNFPTPEEQAAEDK